MIISARNLLKGKIAPLYAGLLVFSMVIGGCASTLADANHPPLTPLKPKNPDLFLATTSSTQDSGLLDVLVPDFEQRSGYRVKTIAVGSGEALKLGQQCNADVLLVHSPMAEKDFMSNNYGSDRRLVMHNDFIIVGPGDDPAEIRSTSTSVIAFTRIAETRAKFISRGDESGTNSMELGIWKSAGITPQGDWYVESGQGMLATLTIASEQAAYTLTDRATYLANKDRLQLEILKEGDAALLNIYHVIAVNPANCPGVNHAAAIAFADYMVSADAQNLIGSFGTEKFGAPLFTPDAGKDESALGK